MLYLTSFWRKTLYIICQKKGILVCRKSLIEPFFPFELKLEEKSKPLTKKMLSPSDLIFGPTLKTT